eukprot:TRINITY_DN2059_c0_g3_i1.p1 TRINITY_DN2059_c0_g3~~TRINITY_DN2059_c0_g3_i1.p1  ORF type:complete len:383 (+),score=88.66 TRINITY_DN2059_c0_g3_i1:66-1214(+)
MEGLVGRPMGGRRSVDVALPASATCLVLLLAMAVVGQAEDGLVGLGRRKTTEDGGGRGFGEGSGGGSLFRHPAARLHSSGLVRLSDGPESLLPAKKGEREEVEVEEGEEEKGEKMNVLEAKKRLTVAVQLQRGSGHPLSPYVEIKQSVGEKSKTKMNKKKKQDQVLHRVGKEACGPVIPALETPDCHVEADHGQGYQLRKYPSGRFWTVATVKNALNYDLAVLKGFLACFNYISGHNSRNEVIEMTGPVRIQPLDVKMSTSNVKTVAYKIAFFVPAKYKTLEDLPLPTVPSIISFEEFTPGVKAVYGPFGGFPDDKVYLKNREKLKAALDKDGIKYDESTLMFAGYSSPFEFLNRKQEVWVDVISSSDELTGPVADVEEKEE